MAITGESSGPRWAQGNDADDGDYTTPLVAAVSGKKIKVTQLTITVLTTAGVVSLKSGSTVIFAQHIALGAPLVIVNPSGVVQTATGEALIPNNATGVDSFCHAAYVEVEP